MVLRCQTTNNGKTYYSNQTWIQDQNRKRIHQILSSQKSAQNWATALSGYVLLEVNFPNQAVNRIKFLSCHSLPVRIAIFVIPCYISRVISGKIFFKYHEKEITNQIIKGNTPFWQKQRRVPELNNLFFFLDDDNNYEPSLLYHGMQQSVNRSQKVLQGFFPAFVASEMNQKISLLL